MHQFGKYPDTATSQLHISDEGLQLGKWSSYPTIYSLSRFYGTWRRNVGFNIENTENRQFHICLNPTGLGWARIDRLANSSLSYKCVGGEGLTSSILMLDGTNYQEWAQKLEAYLRTQELWQYVNGQYKYCAIRAHII